MTTSTETIEDAVAMAHAGLERIYSLLEQLFAQGSDGRNSVLERLSKGRTPPVVIWRRRKAIMDAAHQQEAGLGFRAAHKALATQAGFTWRHGELWEYTAEGSTLLDELAEFARNIRRRSGPFNAVRRDPVPLGGHKWAPSHFEAVGRILDHIVRLARRPFEPLVKFVGQLPETLAKLGSGVQLEVEAALACCASDKKAEPASGARPEEPRAAEQKARVEDVPESLRVSFQQAVHGVPNIVPGIDLPPCSARTLRRWLRHHDHPLGVFEEGKRKSAPSALRPLVRGLLQLHDNTKRRTKPPQWRKPSA